MCYSVHDLTHVQRRVGHAVGQNLRAGREGHIKQRSREAPSATQPIGVKAPPAGQWRRGLVAFDGGPTIRLVTEQQRWGQDGRHPALAT